MATPKEALFVAIPALGHINPLLVQARELQRRGWQARLASTSEARAWIALQSPAMEFVALGPDPSGPRALPDLQASVASRADFLSGTAEIMRWVNTLWPVMYDGLLREMRERKPDVVVADLVTTAGMDAADSAGVPLVVNNADLLTAISVAVLPPAPRLPLLFSRKSLSQIGTLDRLLNPLQRWLGATVVDATLGRQLNALRRTRGLRPRRLTRRVANTLVLTNSAFGLEYSRPLPPLLQMVGPMLDAAPPLSEDLRRWLDDGPPVAFANLGTFARPGSALTERLAEGLDSDTFRSLWVLRGDPPRLPPTVRTERWLPSQVSALAHPNVRAFVSHCGVNSVHESLYTGTPVVGVPLLADQYDMALRIADAGVGLLLDKQHFSASQLRASIHQVATEERFRRPLPAIQSSLRLAGGVRRAADLIEHAAAYGVRHWRQTQ